MGITKEEIIEIEVTMAEIITVAIMILVTSTVVAETMKMVVVLNNIRLIYSGVTRSVVTKS
jgi:hypothetical protein